MEDKSPKESYSGHNGERRWNSKSEKGKCYQDFPNTTFNEALTVLLVVASLLGINIVRRSKTGELRLSSRNMLMSGISLCMVILSLIICLGVFSSIDSSYEQKIILLPLLSSCCFCLYAYVLWLVKSRRLLDYIKEVDTCAIKLRQGRLIPIAVVFYFGYSVFYAFAVYVMIPLPEHVYNFRSDNLNWVFIVSVFFTCLVPAILDLYTFSFIFVLVVAVRSLKKDARAVQMWTKEKTQAVAKTWLKYRKILGIYNEVFSYLLHIRMLMFMVHAITHLFSLVSLDWKIECTAYFWALCGSMTEVMLRFLIVCNSGQKLIDMHESVIKVVREAQFNSSVDADSDAKEISEDADAASWVSDETDEDSKNRMRSTTEEGDAEITSVEISVNLNDAKTGTVEVQQTTDINFSSSEITDENCKDISEFPPKLAEFIEESIETDEVVGNESGPDEEATGETKVNSRPAEENEINAGTSEVILSSSKVNGDAVIIEETTELEEENSGTTEINVTVKTANGDPQITEVTENAIHNTNKAIPTVSKEDMETHDANNELDLPKLSELGNLEGIEEENLREKEDLSQGIERQLKTFPETGTMEKTASARLVMDSLDKICLQNFVRHLEEVPFHARVWGGSPLSAASYINCMGVVFTYLVVLLQLRPGKNLDDNDEDDSGVLRCFMRW